MKTLKTILSCTSIILVILGIISFVTHNVADAIFFIVVAILTRQGVEAYDRKST